jgi:hypothetical protein
LSKRFISIAISLIMLAVGLSVPVGAQSKKELQLTEKARATVLQMGTGTTARVEVKMRDQSKVSGYISEAGQDSFKVTDPKTNSTQTLRYADVAEVKKPGGGLSTKTWLIIGGVAAGAVIVGLAVKPAFCDGGAQTRFPC